MTSNPGSAAAKARSPGRRLQLMMDTRHDPYQARRKPPASSVCPVCRLVCVRGRWQTGEAPADAPDAICPACHRIRDGFPAGYVTIDGPFALEHRAEVLRTARNFAARMQAEHPLQRIMAVDESSDRLLITTTDLHLAQGIGRALYHAFRGRLEFAYAESEYQLRVHWSC